MGLEVLGGWIGKTFGCLAKEFKLLGYREIGLREESDI